VEARPPDGAARDHHHALLRMNIAMQRGVATKISQSKSDAKSGAQIFFAICFGLIEPAQTSLPQRMCYHFAV
jgi:hypothetical protein